MVEEPDGDDEEKEDDECNDERYEGVDAPAREIANVFIKGFGRRLLKCGEGRLD